MRKARKACWEISSIVCVLEREGASGSERDRNRNRPNLGSNALGTSQWAGFKLTLRIRRVAPAHK